MALRTTISHELQADLRTLAQALDAAKKNEAGPLVQDFMARYGWKDQNRVYRHLRAIGWESGRKRRADAGKTAVSEEVLTALGAAGRVGMRENGKATMEVPNAISLLDQNGYTIPVGAARVRQLLRQAHLDTASARLRKPHTALRSEHSNHMHQVDPSLCLLYYAPDGKQRVLHDSEIYRNKPEWVERVGNLKCWRYVLYDHRSAVLVPRYYAAKGETQANLYDFLLYAWRKRPGLPFHGVPRMLGWDKGSANGAAAIENALRALDVESYAHAKGNSQAKGGVECGNNIVEKLFESRLQFEPVGSVEELNAAAERWADAFNANLIPRLDTRIKRPGLAPIARNDLWLRELRQEHLRLLPDEATCRYLLSAKPETRVVRSTPAGGLSIQFAHPVTKRSEYYDLNGIPGVCKDMTVTVSPLIYGNAQVLVRVEDYKGGQATHVLDPVAWDEAGQRADAPVFGVNFKANQDTPVDAAAKRAEETAWPGLDEKARAKAREKGAVPLGGLDAHSHLAHVEIPDYMPRRGTDIGVRNPVAVPVRTLTATELCLALRERLGPAWTPEMGKQVFQAYPDGAPEAEAAAIATLLAGGGDLAPEAANERPKLRALK